jgi:hypothetical protein
MFASFSKTEVQVPVTTRSVFDTLIVPNQWERAYIFCHSTDYHSGSCRLFATTFFIQMIDLTTGENIGNPIF